MKRIEIKHTVVAVRVALVGLMVGGVEGQSFDREAWRQNRGCLSVGQQQDEVVIRIDAVQGVAQHLHGVLGQIAIIGFQQIEATTGGGEEPLPQARQLGPFVVQIVGDVKFEPLQIVAQHGGVRAGHDAPGQQDRLEAAADQPADGIDVGDAPVEEAGRRMTKAAAHLEGDLAVEAQGHVFVEHGATSQAPIMAPRELFVNHGDRV